MRLIIFLFLISICIISTLENKENVNNFDSIFQITNYENQFPPFWSIDFNEPKSGNLGADVCSEKSQCVEIGGNCENKDTNIMFKYCSRDSFCSSRTNLCEAYKVGTPCSLADNECGEPPFFPKTLTMDYLFRRNTLYCDFQSNICEKPTTMNETQFCDNEGFVCKTGLYCRKNKCVRAKFKGETCDPTNYKENPCLPWLYCRNNTQNHGGFVCDAPYQVQKNFFCYSVYDCVIGTTCNYANHRCEELPISKLDKPCTTSSACDPFVCTCQSYVDKTRKCTYQFFPRPCNSQLVDLQHCFANIVRQQTIDACWDSVKCVTQCVWVNSPLAYHYTRGICGNPKSC